MLHVPCPMSHVPRPMSHVLCPMSHVLDRGLEGHSCRATEVQRYRGIEVESLWVSASSKSEEGFKSELWSYMLYAICYKAKGLYGIRLYGY
jgi:hypothetical protein